MKVLTVDDVTSNPLEGKKVAVIGYGAQGRAQALCFNDPVWMLSLVLVQTDHRGNRRPRMV